MKNSKFQVGRETSNLTSYSNSVLRRVVVYLAVQHRLYLSGEQGQTGVSNRYSTRNINVYDVTMHSSISS